MEPLMLTYVSAFLTENVLLLSQPGRQALVA